MPTLYTWTLSSSLVVATPFAFPTFVLAGTVGGGCNGVVHDQSYFLSLFDRILPDAYVGPLKTNRNSGYEILQGAAQVAARASLAVERLECGSIIVFAEGGSYATGTVELYRATTAGGAVTVSAGSVVTTSRGGRDFVTTADAVFGPGDLSVSVAVRSIAPGWEWNVPGVRVTASGLTLAGEIDTCKRLLEVPAYGDPTIQVRQALDTSGGAAPMLDGLGEDRGLPRQVAESDAAYRYRIRTLPDTVSPAALRRAATGVLQPLGLAFDMIETWQVDYQTCWDAPSPNPGTPTYQAVPPTNPAFDNTTFVYDDPRPAYPFKNRWLDEVEFRGAVIFVVPPFGPVLDVGMAYDDHASDTPAAFYGPLGRRATTAFDVPFGLAAALGLQGCYDGFDLGTAGTYTQLWNTLQATKMGGVATILELRGQ